MPDITLINETALYSEYRTTDGNEYVVYYNPSEQTFHYPRAAECEQPVPDSEWLFEVANDEQLSASEANDYFPEDTPLYRMLAECVHCDGLDLAENLTSVEGDDLVCEPCVSARYTACVRCDELYPNNETVSVGDGVACEQCYEYQGMYCDDCDERFWAPHNCREKPRCGCVPHDPVFTLRGAGSDGSDTWIECDTDHEVTLTRTTLAPRTIASLVMHVQDNLVGHIDREPTLLDQHINTVMSVATIIGPAYKTDEGTWAKRLRREYYKVTRNLFGTGVQIPDEIISEVGRRAQESTIGGTKEVRVTRDLNKSAGALGNEESCWWTDYSSALCALKSNGGFALLSGYTDDDVDGRAWVMPCTVETNGTGTTHHLTPTFDEPDAYLVFNGYGDLDERVGPRALAALLGWEYHSALEDFEPRPMYINNSTAHLVLPPNVEYSGRFSASTIDRLQSHAPRHPVTKETPLPQRVSVSDTSDWVDMNGEALHVGDHVRIVDARYAKGAIGAVGVLHDMRRDVILDNVPHPYPVMVGTVLWSAMVVEKVVTTPAPAPAASWDPYLRFSVGDDDPTNTLGLADEYLCRAFIEGGFLCTWFSEHGHPQHVAGTGDLVVAVADAEPRIAPLRTALPRIDQGAIVDAFRNFSATAARLYATRPPLTDTTETSPADSDNGFDLPEAD